MAKKSNAPSAPPAPSNAEYEELLKKVTLKDLFSRKNLSPPTHEETIDELSEAGVLIIEQEERIRKMQVKEDAKKMGKQTNTPSTNPYIRARSEILSKYNKSLRQVLEKMDANIMPRDHRYNQFVKEIIALGDEFSDKQD